MDFSKHKKVGMVFCQVFHLSPLQCKVKKCRNCKRLREFEEKEISRKCCRGDCEWQEGKFLELLSEHGLRIRPRSLFWLCALWLFPRKQEFMMSTFIKSSCCFFKALSKEKHWYIQQSVLCTLKSYRHMWINCSTALRVREGGKGEGNNPQSGKYLYKVLGLSRQFAQDPPPLLPFSPTPHTVGGGGGGGSETPSGRLNNPFCVRTSWEDFNLLYQL